MQTNTTTAPSSLFTRLQEGYLHKTTGLPYADIRPIAKVGREAAGHYIETIALGTAVSIVAGRLLAPFFGHKGKMLLKKPLLTGVFGAGMAGLYAIPRMLKALSDVWRKNPQISQKLPLPFRWIHEKSLNLMGSLFRLKTQA